MRRKRQTRRVPLDFVSRRKDSMVRRHRQVIYLNDNELHAIKQYCEYFNVRRKSALCREILMERILSDLDANPPTLF